MVSLTYLKQLSDQTSYAFRGIYPDTQPVRDLLYFTCVVESGGGKWKKALRGNDLSYFQINRDTAQWLLKHLKMNPQILSTLCQFSNISNDLNYLKININYLLFNNDKFGAGLARIRYGIQSTLVASRDPEYLARYWKKYYNTTRSRTTAYQALKMFREYTD